MSHDPFKKSWMPESIQGLGCSMHASEKRSLLNRVMRIRIWRTRDGANELVGIVVAFIQYH